MFMGEGRGGSTAEGPADFLKTRPDIRVEGPVGLAGIRLLFDRCGRQRPDPSRSARFFPPRPTQSVGWPLPRHHPGEISAPRFGPEKSGK